MSKADGRPGKGPEFFFNRELSWLAFNERVLEEAVDATNPLLERVKFATIVASNLDEFFMVRVAALQTAIFEGDASPDASGLTPAQQVTAISRRVHQLVGRLYELLTGTVLPALAGEGLRVVPFADLAPVERDAALAHVRDQVLPALTPLAIDFSRPFPMLSSLSLNLAFLLAPEPGADRPRLGIVQLPPLLPRLVRIAGEPGTFVLIDDVLRTQAEALFPGQQVMEAVAFRLTRDSELELDDEGGLSYLEALEEELRKRRRKDVVRLEIEAGASDVVVDLLAGPLQVEAQDTYRVQGPLDARVFWALVELPGYDHLRDRPLKPAVSVSPQDQARIFEVLEERDILLHHPYESFDPVVALLEAAADDPDVLAIRQTLYRTSGDSPVVAALTRAADAGKQVTVVLELMARFDEQRNIQWARRLEEAGAHVIYGVRGYKVHAKACLVVRRTREGVRRYLHLGTGNYNDKTARLYSDIGLMTSSPEFTADAAAFFSSLTGYSDPPRTKALVMAPTQLRDRLLKLVEREIRRAEAGQPAMIRAKMNSLVDVKMIHALYKASRAGVQVFLNVRGICTLRPGVPGLSENIQVISIVGRFLEHARIFQFHNGGDENVFLASADWMTRNLDHRIELMFPVLAADTKRKVLAVLDAMFRDNVKARRLSKDGTYRTPPRHRGEERFEAQRALYEQALAEAARAQHRPAGFEPIESAAPTR
jgi:polyphosphate kinase